VWVPNDWRCAAALQIDAAAGARRKAEWCGLVGRSRPLPYLRRQHQRGLGSGYARRVACSYARSKRAKCAFCKIRRLFRPQGLRPLWYLKSIHLVRGFA
jgi:hypothetical protein